MVGESFQLSESHTVVRKLSLSEHGLHEVDAVLVVGGDHYQAVLLDVIEGECHTFVVAGMRLCNIVPHR